MGQNKQTTQKLGRIHKVMLGLGKFHLDVLCSPQGWEAADDLVRMGYVTSFISGGQGISHRVYTNYTITEKGKEALANEPN